MSSNPPTRVPTPPPDCSCDDHDLAPLAPPVEPQDPTTLPFRKSRGTSPPPLRDYDPDTLPDTEPEHAPFDAAPAPAPERPRRNVSRRGFTAGLGAALLAAPFLGLLTRANRASAATGRTAKRLVVFFTPNGTVPAQWRPTGTETAWSFPAGSILEPLAPHKDKLVVIDGLQFTNSTNHEGGMAAMLTGGGGAGTASRGMSVDQHVAAAIGGTSRLRSLELGVQTSAWGGSVQTRMSYTAPGQYAPPDDSPRGVYGRVFGAATPTPGGADLVLARRRSVLDAVKGDLGDLKSRLGTSAQVNLEQHLESLRELERGLGGGATCSGGTPVADLPLYDNANFPAIGKTQMDLLVASLACGSTKVASLQWAHTVAPHVFTWLGQSDSHHSLSHMDDGNTAGVASFVKAERWFSEQFGYLIGKLAATPDPAGGTMLDSTLVVWCKEMGDSRAHVCTDVPFVLAGGGAFSPGRYLKASGASHTKLLVSICQAMGLTNTSFGDPATGSGPLAGL